VHPNCLKAIRSDNGTKFRNASFDQFCLEDRTPRHRTPRRFWANAISIVCYISNRIFLRSILYLTPFELCFGRKSFVHHLRPFRCKYFILKCRNLDKFESHSFDDIWLGYTPHGRSY
jgi:hypothetical protein